MNSGNQINLPSFICVGAQKAGSSTLYQLLCQHPEVYMSETKEVHYFDKEENYAKGLTYYSDFFADANKEIAVIGEVTPEYLPLSYVPDRIKKDLGEIKILIILRHPVLRAYSQYSFHQMLGYEKDGISFEERLRAEKAEHEIEKRSTWYDPAFYVSKSLYFHQVKRYIDLFGKKNVHVVLFEDIIDQSGNALDSICDFLQIQQFDFELGHSNPTILNYNSFWMNLVKKINKMLFSGVNNKLFQGLKNTIKGNVFKKPEKLSKEKTSALYTRYFKEDVEKLEVLLERDLSIWHNF